MLEGGWWDARGVWVEGEGEGEGEEEFGGVSGWEKGGGGGDGVTSMNSPRSSAVARSSSASMGVVVVATALDFVTVFFPSLLRRETRFFFGVLSIGFARAFRTGSLRQSRKISKLDCSSGGIDSAITS